MSAGVAPFRHIAGFGALYGSPPYRATRDTDLRWYLVDASGANCYGRGRNTWLASRTDVEEIIAAYAPTAERPL